MKEGKPGVGDSHWMPLMSVWLFSSRKILVVLGWTLLLIGCTVVFQMKLIMIQSHAQPKHIPDQDDRLMLAVNKVLDRLQEGDYDTIPETVTTASFEAADFTNKQVSISDSNLTNLSYIYEYTSANGTVKYGQPLHVRYDTLRALGLPPDSFTELTWDNKDDLALVTANSASHFKESLDAIASAQRWFPKLPILYYDWGLTDEQRQNLSTFCNVKIQHFNFSIYGIPDFHRYRQIKYQIAKAFVVQDALRRFPGVILMDASFRFLDGNLTKVQRVAVDNGGVCFFTKTGHSSYAMTHNGTYSYLPSSMQDLKTVRQVQSGAMLIYNTRKIFQAVLWWWYLCSLNRNCVAPIEELKCDNNEEWMTVYHGCHRYDQSVINVLLGNLYNFQLQRYYLHPQKPKMMQIFRRPTELNEIQICK